MTDLPKFYDPMLDSCAGQIIDCGSGGFVGGAPTPVANEQAEALENAAGLIRALVALGRLGATDQVMFDGRWHAVQVILLEADAALRTRPSGGENL